MTESTVEFGLDDFRNIRPTKPAKAKLAISIWMYGAPMLFFVGIIGNILILIVMSQRRMRGTSTSIYLKCMALADIFALVFGMLPEWLEETKFVILRDIHESICKMEKFCFFACSDASIWICVVFTVDRFVAVCFPLEQRRFSKSHHALLYSGLALSLAIIKNLHFFWTRGSVYKTTAGTNITQLSAKCGQPNLEYDSFEIFVRPWIAFTIVMAIPCLVIIICNVFIIRAMVRLKHDNRRHIILSANDKSIVQMTTLCLTASFCFVIFITPSIILRIGKPYWNVDPKYTYEVVKAVVNLTFYANHSINFFLYCMTGQRFREALKVLFVKDAALGYLSTPRNSYDVTAACQISPNRSRSLAVSKYDSKDVKHNSNDVINNSSDFMHSSNVVINRSNEVSHNSNEVLNNSPDKKHNSNDAIG